MDDIPGPSEPAMPSEPSSPDFEISSSSSRTSPASSDVSKLLWDSLTPISRKKAKLSLKERTSGRGLEVGVRKQLGVNMSSMLVAMQPITQTSIHQKV